jgi:hypothetical protein
MDYDKCIGEIMDYDKCIGEIRNAQINLVKLPQMKSQHKRNTSKCEGNKTASETFGMKLYNILYNICITYV